MLLLFVRGTVQARFIFYAVYCKINCVFLES